VSPEWPAPAPEFGWPGPDEPDRDAASLHGEAPWRFVEPAYRKADRDAKAVQ